MKRFANVFLIFLLYIFAIKELYATKNTIILATTTSTQDSGLLDVLIPLFEKKTGYFVKTIAVGSGQALMLGKRGEADILLVHSPEAEIKFINSGYGINRRRVMHNDFVLLGPKEDPANVKNSRSIKEAFKRVAEQRALFISRGDNSGTHVKELNIWKIIGKYPDKERWYQQTGSGMGQTLSVANEKNGYTLSDRGTYLALKRNLILQILKEGDEELKNIYHVIEINPERFSNINHVGARALADFFVSKEVQKIIKTFGVDRFGSPLFFPDAVDTIK